MTALIVPVASTTSRISPRSTLAVKCCTWLPRFKPKAANSPINATTPARISHLLLTFIVLQKTAGASLVAQRFNGVQRRCLSGRIISKKHSDCDREQRGNDDSLQGHFHRPLQCSS